MRRRPVEHKRIVGNKVYTINKGVAYELSPSKKEAAGRARGVRDAAKSLATPPPPPPPSSPPGSESGGTNGNGILGPERKPEYNIDPETGEGEIILTTERGRRVTLRVGPNMVADSDVTTRNIDLSNTNIPGSVIANGLVENVKFNGANLEGSHILPIRREGYEHSLESGRGRKEYPLMREVSFDGANLSKTVVGPCHLEMVSFVDVDAKDTTFLLVENSYGIDIRGSNITPEQFRTEAGRDIGPLLVYDRFSMEETSRLTGLSPEELSVEVWAGDIEVRDLFHKSVEGKFDGEKMHFPQWEVRRLIEREMRKKIRGPLRRNQTPELSD